MKKSRTLALTLATTGLVGTMLATPALAASGDPVNVGGEVTRLAGVDRYETAAKISADTFPDGSDTLYVATGENFPDALTASAAAGYEDAPVLLVRPGEIPMSVSTEIQRLAPTRIVIVGSDRSVSATVATDLKLYAPDAEVVRYGGEDRYETSAMVAAALHSTIPVQDGTEAYQGSVYIATGENFPDALSGATQAALDQAPLLLVRPNGVPTSTAAYLDTITPSRYVVFGSDATVTKEATDRLQAIKSADVEREGGIDRYETSAIVATNIDRFNKLGNVTTPAVFVSTGLNYADALTAGAAAAQYGSPLVLTDGKCVTQPVADVLQGINPDFIVLTGGTDRVSNDVLKVC